MNSRNLEIKFSHAILNLAGLLSVLAATSLAISYRPVADDYQQVMNVINLGSTQYYQEIRTILDSSLLGSLSYFVFYEFLGNTALWNWILVVLSQFVIATFLLYKLLSISLGMGISKNSKLLFGISSLSILVFSCFGSPQKSYMSLTWTASFFAHTVPELLMYILGITLIIRKPEELNKKKIVLLAALISHWGAIDPIISLLTIAPILVWKAVKSTQKTDESGALATPLKFYGLILGVMLSGVVILIFGPSSQRRITLSEFQTTNSGDFIERFIGIAVLAFRENIVSNAISFLIVFLLGILAAALKNNLKFNSNLSWSVIFAILFLVVFRKLVLIGAESISYFGVWHHGTASIMLLCFVFLVAFKLTENSNLSSSILLLSSTLFLGGQMLLISDIDLQSNQIQRGWEENKMANLQNCNTKNFEPNYRFSYFLESPKTSTWQELSCSARTSLNFAEKSSILNTPTALFKIQMKLKHLFDEQILGLVSNAEIRDSLRRQLY